MGKHFGIPHLELPYLDTRSFKVNKQNMEKS